MLRQKMIGRYLVVLMAMLLVASCEKVVNDEGTSSNGGG